MLLKGWVGPSPQGEEAQRQQGVGALFQVEGAKVQWRVKALHREGAVL